VSLLPRISSEPIEITTETGKPITIKHGFGRQLAGWLVIWSDAPISFYVHDNSLDTSQEVTLVPSASAFTRLVLL